jgi:hypothetical protein
MLIRVPWTFGAAPQVCIDAPVAVVKSSDVMSRKTKEKGNEVVGSL